MPHSKPSTRRARMRPLATMMLSTLTLTLLGTGCVTTKVVQISSDRMVVSVRQGVPFTPPCDGKFVPTERFNEMMDVYIQHSFEK